MESLIQTMFPNSRRLTATEAPGLMGCVEDIARKVGCSAPPVYLFPSRQFNAAIYPAGQSMIVFQGALDATGSTLKNKPTPMLEAVLAHEMGHWKNAFRHFGPTLGLIAGGSLIASASVYLYDRAHRQQRADKEQGKNVSLGTAFGEVAHDMGQKSFWQNFKEYYAYYQLPIFSIVGAADTQPGSWGEYMKRQVTHIAASTAGLAMALPMTRPFALRSEFEADAFAAKLVGKDTYIEMLNKIHGGAEKSAMHTATKLGNPKAGEDVLKSMKRWFKHVLQETAMAHPSWAERVAAVEKLAPAIARLPH